MNLKEKHYVGVDCHKDTIACYINGRFKEFKTDFKGFTKALEWVKKIEPNCAWAIEGAYSYGLTLSKFLLSSGCEVYEFNALVTAKARKALSISGEKNDMGDAKVISIFAKQVKMQEVSLKTIELKRLITTRRLLVKQRTEIILSIKNHCMKEGIILPFNSLTTKKAISWLLNCDDFNLNIMANNLKVQYESIKKLEEQIQKATPEKVNKLREITGIETLTASIFYTETKGNKMSKAEFASYCGVAPVECSSGLSTRFRNNKRGNRTLNSLLYSISIFQSRFDEEGSKYFQKKLAEGKSKRLARKCLARQVSNLIWKILFAA
jgi:transposase